MWAIISTSKQLRFYDPEKNRESLEVEGVGYCIEYKGYAQKVEFDHNNAVTKLLINNIPLFIKKSDARKEAIRAGLVGFKYLKLNPSIIKLTQH